MRRDGTGHKELLSLASASDLHPTWSDHGFWIAYRHTTDTDQDIHRIRSDGSRDEVVVATSFAETMPAWSPDGERIAVRCSPVSAWSP